MLTPEKARANFHPQTPDVKEPLGRAESVIVVGGSVAGATASFLLARQGVDVLCLDPRDIREKTLPPCTGCGGLIQEQTVELLQSIGITIPDSVIRRRLAGFTIHLPKGGKLQVPIQTLAVYRGFGPLGNSNQRKGFDAFLLEKAIEAGARFEQDEVTGIKLQNEGKALVQTKTNRVLQVDLVVGAFGHNQSLVERISLPEGKRLDAVGAQKSTVFELALGNQFCHEAFGNQAHIAIVPQPFARRLNVWFAAFIPKDEGIVSVVLMGRKDVKPADADQFFSSEYVKALLPDAVQKQRLWNTSLHDGGVRSCVCSKNTMTNRQPKHFLVKEPGGMVFVGDAGPTRWGKDGIGAAVDTALAAVLAVLRSDLEQYRRFAKENYPPGDWRWARGLMRLNDLIISIPGAERALQAVNQRRDSWTAQVIEEHMRHLLTGDIPYQNVLPEVLRKAVSLAFHSS